MKRMPPVALLLLLALLLAFQGREAGAQQPSIPIYMASGAFDPLKTAPPIDETLTLEPSDAQRYWLVQFEGPIQKEWREGVESMGAEIMRYIPDYTYLVRLSGRDRGRLQQVTGVRAIVTYHAGFKISPLLRNLHGQQDLVISLFKGEDSEPTVRAIKARGGTVEFPLPGQRARVVQGSLDVSHLGEMALLQEVAWIEPFFEPSLDNDVARGIMDVAPAWDALGLYGEGQIVAVADSGLGVGDYATLHEDLRDRVDAAFAWGRPPDDWSDPHGHGTHVAGSVLGNGLESGSNPAAHDYTESFAGVAPEAHLVFQSLGDASGGLGGIPADLNDLFQQAYNADARIHTNSWGTTCIPDCSGEYRNFTRQIDEFMWNHPDFLILRSPGNEGEDGDSDGKVDDDSLNLESSAKNAITVGASENERFDPAGPAPLNSVWGGSDFPQPPINGDYVADDRDGMAAFSSRGPTIDGRFKPDVVAPGTNIVSVRSQDPSADPDDLWGAYDGWYVYGGGTSMSTPLVAGAAALVREFYMAEEGLLSPSAALIKATLMNGAQDISPGQYGTGLTQEVPEAPNSVEGWGRVDLGASIYPGGGSQALWYRDIAAQGALETEDITTYQIDIDDSSVALVVTLAYTDYPGSEMATQATPKLVNDLDLKIISPTDAAFYPNGLSEPDHRNNVERIVVDSPEVGTYTLEVSGFHVPVGPQPYSLVASGHLVALLADLPDLIVLASDEPYVVPSGQTLIYTLTIVNLGAGEATGVVVRNGLPPEVSTVSSVIPSQGSCSDITPPDIRCELGTLSAGGSATITIEVVAPTVSGPATITSQATVDPDDTVAESDESNNGAEEDTTVSPTTILVDSTGDTDAADGVITLYEAIHLTRGTLGRALDSGEEDNVEGTAGPDSVNAADAIWFDTTVFPPSAPATISLTQNLPEVGWDGSDTIDETTIDGSAAGVIINGKGHNCMEIWSSNNTIRGLEIKSCGLRAVDIEDAVTSGTLYPAENNHIEGMTIYGCADGIWVAADNNTIGGLGAGQGNVIWGNTGNGIVIQEGWVVGSGDNPTTGNTIIGNVIWGNKSDGVLIWEQDGASNTNGTAVTTGNTIVGNVISGNTGAGVRIKDGTTTANDVKGNKIGTNANGTRAWPNGEDGVIIANGAENNIIGGSADGEGNLISGNTYSAVWIRDTGTTGNKVIGNLIGTDVNGSVADPNRWGVYISDGAQNNVIGGSLSGEGNLISGNTIGDVSGTGYGVMITGSGTDGNQVLGNHIGADVSGTSSLENRVGIVINGGAQDNTVGGSGSGEGNLISGNTLQGVWIGNPGTSSNRVIGNRIGTADDGTSALGNQHGVTVADGAQNNVIGGGEPGERNLISGNTSSGVRIKDTGTTGNEVIGNHIGTDVNGTTAVPNGLGVYIGGGAQNNTIGGSGGGEGNLISGNTFSGVSIQDTGTTGNEVMGNRIGTDVNGTTAVPNGPGVYIGGGAQNNTIGGFGSSESNLISGNSYGVYIAGAGSSANIIMGNRIGTDAVGTAAVPNDWGIFVGGGAQDNTIGGSGSGEGNLISGNDWGVDIFGTGSSGNVVIGNRIGTDVNGTAAVPNGLGVYISGGAQDNTIGGSGSGQGNLISGNDWGVYIAGAGSSGNVVMGNRIGTDLDGASDLGNTYGGVVINSASDNIIGGTAATQRNVISGNNSYGVRITGTGATGNQVQGNYIGTQMDGTGALGNTLHGVYINGAATNTIGGTPSGAANTIAFNGGDGVRVDGVSSIGDTIRGNSIHSNGGIGIENINGGNDDLAPPVITGAGSASGTACANCTVDVYSDIAAEGRVYHGSAPADGLGDWSFPGAVIGPNVTATATDASGNTSEFSAPFACTDADGDSVCDSGDPCPANPDCDGDSLGLGDPFGLFFRDGVEVFIGTLVTVACAATSTIDDEDPDAFGPDWDDSQGVDGSDLFLFAERFGTEQGVPPPIGKKPYLQQFDIYPTDVSLHKIDGSDLFVLASYFGKSCP